ncbi:hypothetical protein G9A89_019578 [Geosiphon pyriformis]|nr:hypothetical protein G9A89_019578 [Geosiphon pyriformis]
MEPTLEKELVKPTQVQGKKKINLFTQFAKHLADNYNPDKLRYITKDYKIRGRVDITHHTMLFTIIAPEIRYLSTWNKNRENIFKSYPDIEDAKVDKIFYTDFLEAKDEIILYLLNMINTSTKTGLYLLGHRLGGVYAIFTALLIQELSSKIENFIVYTFGLPRIGNMEFARHVNNQLTVYRVTLMDDQITRFPFQTSNIAHVMYVHPGMEYWIKTQCDCDRFDLIYCPVIDDKDEDILIENPYCNNAQPEHEPKFTYDGPYFGYTYGHIKKHNKYHSLMLRN